MATETMMRPSEEDLEATQRFYDRISHAYDLLADASEAKAREAGLGLLAPAVGERLLEIGFGTGHQLEEMARAVGDEGKVVGIDLSRGMCEMAQRRLHKQQLTHRVEIRREAVPPILCEDASFDGAFLSFTLELFEDDVRPTLLAELARVLTPGGRLAVVAMADPPGHHAGAVERAYRWMHRHFPHIVDCRPIDVEGELRRAGFGVEESELMELWHLPVMAVRAVPGG